MSNFGPIKKAVPIHGSYLSSFLNFVFTMPIAEKGYWFTSTGLRVSI